MLGERIKESRKLKNITQKDLASALSVTKSAVSLWEKGTREPDISTLRKIAEILEVSVDYLIGKTDEEEKKSELAIEEIKKAASGDDARSRVLDLVSCLNQTQSYLVLAYIEGLLAQIPPESNQAAPADK